MEQKFWKQRYPQMPESFHLVVKNAVEKALSESEREDVPPEKPDTMRLMKNQSTEAAVCGIMAENRHPAAREQRIPGRKKISILILAAALAAALTAVGALSFAGRDRKTPEEMIRDELNLDPETDYSSLMETDVPVKTEEMPVYPDFVPQEDIDSYEKLETDEPLLEIESVYYDGLTLAFVASPTEEAQKYVSFESFGTRINGQAGAAGLMYAEGKFNLEEENADKDTAVSGYYFSGTTCGLKLESPFTVTVPLRVYGENGRCKNQDLTFTINLPSQTKKLPDQEFAQDDFTVTLTGLKKSPASLYGTITVEMTEAQYNTWQQTSSTGDALMLLLSHFTDAEGNTCTLRSLKEITETSETSETAEATEIKESTGIEGAPDTTDTTDISTASVLTDLTLTDDVYTASTPFLVTLPLPGLTELTLTLTTRAPAEADNPNPTITTLGAPIQLTLESQ